MGSAKIIVRIDQPGTAVSMDSKEQQVVVVAVMGAVTLLAVAVGFYVLSDSGSAEAFGQDHGEGLFGTAPGLGSQSMPLGAGQVTVGTHVIADADVKGAVFDCDGTLVDSMSAWLPSWKAACMRFGLDVPSLPCLYNKRLFFETCLPL